MNFTEIAMQRQSCRSYDESKDIEQEKLDRILESARLSPSACNGQPYHVTVCKGDAAKKVAELTAGMGLNKFAVQAPVCLVISEEDYNSTALVGSKIKGNDYRSIDIGILAAYITAEATAQGIDSCILGWLDDKKIRKLCDLTKPVRLVITLGYKKENVKLRDKKRKALNELVSYK